MFYIGSYGIKFALADVDTKQMQIDELFYYAKSNIPYKNSIVYSNNHKFTDAIMAQGLNSILAHKQNQRLNFFTDKKTHYSGVANELFLQATNGKDFLEHVYEVARIKIEVINKTQELELKYDSVIASLGRSKTNDMMLWHTGKESVEFLYKENNNIKIQKIVPTYDDFYMHLKKKLAKNMILNPLTEKEILHGLDIAIDFIQIPQNTLNSLSTRTNVIGIGPIHNYVAQHYVNFNNIQNLIKQVPKVDLWKYTRDELKKAVLFLANKENKEIVHLMYNNRSYYNVDKEMSNMMFLYGIMHKLDIHNVKTVNPKNTFGLLVQK